MVRPVRGGGLAPGSGTRANQTLRPPSGAECSNVILNHGLRSASPVATIWRPSGAVARGPYTTVCATALAIGYNSSSKVIA